MIPQQLLPKACAHKVCHSSIHEAHLHVPPSFGEPETSGWGAALLDDLAPQMAKIVYEIRVQVKKYRPEDGGQTIVSEASKKLRVKPAFEEEPPLDLGIYGKHEDHCLRQEKTIRKGVLKGKMGRLVMEAFQPKEFALPAIPAGKPVPAISTMVKISLRFDPVDEKSPPPRLGSLNSKLKVSTYYAASPRQNYPSRATLAFDMSQGYISEFLALSNMCVSSVEWRRHEGWESPISRRDSALSTISTMTTATISSNTASAASIPDPSANYKGRSFYTATVLVPLTLPTNKHFVPTFHTCLVSRVYGIHLGLSCGPIGSSLTLKLPVQISSEGSVGSAERRRRSVWVDEAIMEVDEAFEPRNTGPPPEEYLGQSQLGGEANDLPGYSMFSHPGIVGDRPPLQAPVRV